MNISHHDDRIDINDLAVELGEWLDEIEDYCESNSIPHEQHGEWDDYEMARDFLTELNNYADCGYCINEFYFEDYAKEIANDCYDIEDRWPYSHIDWEAAADELKMDYTALEWNGIEFYTQ